MTKNEWKQKMLNPSVSCDEVYPPGTWGCQYPYVNRKSIIETIDSRRNSYFSNSYFSNSYFSNSYFSNSYFSNSIYFPSFSNSIYFPSFAIAIIVISHHQEKIEPTVQSCWLQKRSRERWSEVINKKESNCKQQLSD